MNTATSKEALALSVEQWFEKYGVAILQREQNLKARAATAGR
jgi:hypothetical protein